MILMPGSGALAQKPPGPEHLLGTDRYGRDMLSRVIIGSTTSIYATLLWLR